MIKEVLTFAYKGTPVTFRIQEDVATFTAKIKKQNLFRAAFSKSTKVVVSLTKDGFRSSVLHAHILAILRPVLYCRFAADDERLVAGRFTFGWTARVELSLALVLGTVLWVGAVFKFVRALLTSTGAEEVIAFAVGMFVAPCVLYAVMAVFSHGVVKFQEDVPLILDFFKRSLEPRTV